MNIHVTSHKRGDIRNLTITITANDFETVDLIDCLSAATGSARIMAGKITDTIGMVNLSPMDEQEAMAYTLRRFADLLDRQTR